MSSLHTISRSPDSSLLDTCLTVINDGDALLFIEDGAYHATSQDLLATICSSIQVYALREDILARALLMKIHDRVECVDFQRFVELSCEHDKVISWF